MLLIKCFNPRFIFLRDNQGEEFRDNSQKANIKEVLSQALLDGSEVYQTLTLVSLSLDIISRDKNSPNLQPILGQRWLFFMQTHFLSQATCSLLTAFQGVQDEYQLRPRLPSGEWLLHALFLFWQLNTITRL